MSEGQVPAVGARGLAASTGPRIMFDPVALKNLLTKLAPQQRLAFSLSCGERLYPNYVAFAAEQGWGEPSALRSALDLVWDVILDQPHSQADVRELKKRVEEAEPDTEDFGTILGSSALDAAATAGLVLVLLEADDPDVAVEIASLARDSVDMYIQVIEHLDPSDTELERKILRHPLMQAELRRQREDVRQLSSTPWTSKEARRKGAQHLGVAGLQARELVGLGGQGALHVGRREDGQSFHEGLGPEFEIDARCLGTQIPEVSNG